VAFTLFSGVAFGVGQGAQKRQSPDSPGPRNLGNQRQTYPPQASGSDEVRMAESNRVALDALGRDLRTLTPLQSVSSLPTTSGPSGANASTSKPKSTRLASMLEHFARLKTRWGSSGSSSADGGPWRAEPSSPSVCLQRGDGACHEHLEMSPDALGEEWRERGQSPYHRLR
jgi:hypothetical protein